MELDAASTELTSSGAIIGPVWFAVGDVAFPEEGWYDFPAVVLAWWIDALRAVAGRSDHRASLRFMDGPFEVHVDQTNGTTTARFLRSGRPLLPDAEIEPQELLASAVAGAVRLVAVLRERGVTSAELERLSSVAEKTDGT